MKIFFDYQIFYQQKYGGISNYFTCLALELTKLGAKRALILSVAGAFHSPIMNSAKEALKIAIKDTHFNNPICPIYQNVCASPITNTTQLKKNLIKI